MLDRAGFDRQLDVYRLAQGGDRQCQRLWNDFLAASPDMARLVVQYAQVAAGEAASARKAVDKTLNKAEKKPKAKPAGPQRPVRGWTCCAPTLQAVIR